MVSSSAWRRRRVLILCYHGVSLSDEHLWDPELFVTRQFLADRMQLLRDLDCAVLPLGDAVRRLKRGELPPKAVAVTFDDGLYDFLAVAAPILRRFEIPATVYASTYHCVHQSPVLRLSIRYLMWKARMAQTHDLDLGGSEKSLAPNKESDREVLARLIYERAHSLCPFTGERSEFMARTANSLGIDWQQFVAQRQFALMTPDELRAVSDLGLNVELHTHRHRTPRDQALFVREISENADVIESATSIRPRHFCYPSGDYDLRFIKWLEAAGVESATTCEVGLANSHHHPMLLPRFIDTMGQSRESFVGWVTGLNELLTPTKSVTTEHGKSSLD